MYVIVKKYFLIQFLCLLFGLQHKTRWFMQEMLHLFFFKKIYDIMYFSFDIGNLVGLVFSTNCSNMCISCKSPLFPAAFYIHWILQMRLWQQLFANFYCDFYELILGIQRWYLLVGSLCYYSLNNKKNADDHSICFPVLLCFIFLAMQRVFLHQIFSLFSLKNNYD